MAYDEGLAPRIRERLDEQAGLSEKRRLGGLAFLVNGNLAVGVVKHELMVRVGPEAYATALREPHARPRDLTTRPMTGFVFASEEGCEDDRALPRWIERGVCCAAALPPKWPARPGYSSRLFVFSLSAFSRMKARISSAMPRMRSHSS